MKAIEEGDLVALKSGGPYMSVVQLLPTAAVCMWFDSSGQLQERTFPLSALERQQQQDDGVSGS